MAILLSPAFKIFINQFPDEQGDRLSGKKNLVVRIGKEQSIRYFALLLISAYLLMFLNLILLELPQYMIAFIIRRGSKRDLKKLLLYEKGFAIIYL